MGGRGDLGRRGRLRRTSETPPPPGGEPEHRGQRPGSPTPSPTAPSKAEDAAALKKAMVTAADLGKPWVEPKKASCRRKAAEACPGQPSAVDKVTRWRRSARSDRGQRPGRQHRQFPARHPADRGRRRGAGRVREGHQGLPDLQGRQRALRRLHAEGPTSADNADEILLSRAERIYYDKAHKKLAYARHTVVARTGRVVTYVSYAFLTTKKDPGAKDFSRASRAAGDPAGQGRQHVLRSSGA